MVGPSVTVNTQTNANVSIVYSATGNEIVWGTGSVNVTFAPEGPHPEIMTGNVKFTGQRGNIVNGRWDRSETGNSFRAEGVEFRNNNKGPESIYDDISLKEPKIIPLKDGKVDLSSEGTRKTLSGLVEQAWPEAARQKLRLDPENPDKGEKKKQVSLGDMSSLKNVAALMGTPIEVGNESKMASGPQVPGGRSKV